MSTQQGNADSSLNNLPERNAAKGTSDPLTQQKNKEDNVPRNTEEKGAPSSDVPLDKHGDSWGGGIPHHNNQFNIACVQGERGALFTMNQMKKKRFAVVGGGWSGLYALKYLLEEEVQVQLYEKEANLGGVWFYKEREGGVYQSTHVTSSKTYLHASDFPLGEEIPHFPKHDQILEHLYSYANYFHLWAHMVFQCEITQIDPYGDNQWKIQIQHHQNRREEIFDGIVIATGQHQTANDPRHLHPFNKFTGTMSHSISYKQPNQSLHREKNILIVGGGETASDLAVELSSIARSICMSIRNGQWFQERLAGDQPADILFTKSLGFFGLYDNIWVRIGWTYFIRPFWGEGGSGIKQWKPSSRLFHSFINKSRDVVNKVALGMVKPKRGIKTISGNLITFDDDNEQGIHIDHILFCTGYKWSHPFFKPILEEQMDVKYLYELIFPLNYPNLAFIGSARPVFGSIPSLAELQARRVAQIYSGKASLPSVVVMSQWLTKYWKRHEELYPSDKRLKQLVNQFEYTEFLANRMNIQPRLWKLFFYQPLKWYKIYFESPWSPFLFRLNDIQSDEEKLAYSRHLRCIPQPAQTFHQYLVFIRWIFFIVLLCFFGIPVLLKYFF